MSVDTEHKEYTDNIGTWEKIDDICDANNVDQYLLTLNPTDPSKEMEARNLAYRNRAIFYQVAGYTSSGMLGMIFAKKPVLVVPDSMDYMTYNANGSGLSIYQLSQMTAREVIRKSRAGLFVSFPDTGGVVSQADMDSGGIFSTIHHISADQIINWGEMLVGSRMMLSFVVIKEEVEEEGDDKFDVDVVDQRRVLSLEDGVFVISLYRKNDSGDWIIYGEPKVPLDGGGNKWNEIPFVFVGADNNDSCVDEPYMKGLVDLNIGHFRNSADWEESVWFCGQPQPWMSGITQEHLDLMSKNNMYFGCAHLVGVPSGETLGIVQADPNPVVRQAMIDKIDMMVGMGARYIQPNSSTKTATEAEGDQKSQHSILSTISENVSSAYTKASMFAARYMSEPEDDVLYATTTDFVAKTATAQELQAVIGAFIQGALPPGDYFAWLQSRGLVAEEKTIDEFLEDVGRVRMPNLGE